MMNPDFRSGAPEIQARIFRAARTHSAFLQRTVPDVTLRSLYELCCWGPTSMNTQPMRIVFVRSEAGKQRLISALKPGNVAKVHSAPVTAIPAVDTRFFDMEPHI